MSELLKNHPPMPEWHGMPPDLVDRYLAFARRHQVKSVVERIRDIESRIKSIGSARTDASDTIKYYRKKVTESTDAVKLLQSNLAALSDIQMYEEGLLRLMYDPCLLGIRVNSAGRLVLHLRAYKEDEDELQYVGDFEFDLDLLNRDSVLFVQTDISDSAQTATIASQVYDTREGIIQSILYASTQKSWGLLRDGDLCGVANALVERLCQDANTKRRLRLDNIEPEPTWQGIVPGVERALARTLDFVVRSTMQQKLTTAESDLAAHKAHQKHYTNQLRSLNVELTEKRAELKKLQAVAESPVFDEEVAKEELRYMTSLPGVMGIRFEDVDGTGLVPVIHVRTTMVYNGQRYDMGDYELVLRPYHDNGAAVIVTRQTRKARRGGIYYHDRGDSYRCSCCVYLSWFCFGDRALELTDMFERGDFGTFLHLAINSMNAINPGDISYYRLEEYFSKIDDDAVWVPRVTTARRRPRRRWLASVVSVL